MDHHPVTPCQRHCRWQAESVSACAQMCPGPSRQLTIQPRLCRVRAMSSLRMTLPTQMVLRALLDEPTKQQYGLELCARAGLQSGTLYPILARLEQAGWIESAWEDPEVHLAEGRPRRRYYQ